MIEVRSRPGALRVQGHAGSGDHGHDLVCAGASMLIYTLAEQLMVLAAEGRIPAPKIRLAPGDAALRWEQTDETRIVQGCILHGLELLQAEYPEYVRILRDDTERTADSRPYRQEEK